jgi:hypothetical protein
MAVVLARQVGEFRLQKKIRSRYHSGAIRGLQPLAHPRFEVVTTLVRGVNAPEAAAESKFGECSRSRFLPGCAVKKIGDGCWKMWQTGRYRSVLPQDHLIIVKTVSVPQSAQFFPSLEILDRPGARSRKIVTGNRVLHAL